MAIFEHVDGDGDAMEVRAFDEQDYIIFDAVRENGRGASVRLGRGTVARLHTALSQWLWPDNGYATAPPPAPQADHSLIDQLIRRAAAEAVTAATGPDMIRSLAREEFEKLFAEKTSARVLPLHLSPAAEGCECGHPALFHSEDNGCVHWYRGEQVFCPCTRGLGGLEEDAFPEADPEPGDVGHPGPAEPYAPPIHLITEAECQVAGCTSRHLTTAPEEHGRLMSELPKRVRPRGECGECGHSWAMHPPSFGVSYCAQYTDAVVCGCSRVQPRVQPRVECTCGHPLIPAMHNRLGCQVRGCTCRYTGTSTS